ncbi:hypothetical protein EV356DRAFT_499947 [Viridothelium virens]|uniref:Uncharacterized protein n=1 Tax=Viridothelium virens TaxID=1048519 RepID=A0A6A6HNN6_VIRVR|nr:hypothetical protein EV356DRAFT_499947 [Viridothelium virens]
MLSALYYTFSRTRACGHVQISTCYAFSAASTTLGLPLSLAGARLVNYEVVGWK